MSALFVLLFFLIEGSVLTILVFYYKGILEKVSMQRTYNPRQKSWHACPLFQYLSRKLISSPPSPQFNVVYGDEVVIACFKHCRGERGFLIPLVIACQRMFQLSDPEVPRTFVEDCSNF